MMETVVLCGATLYGFVHWMEWAERRDIRRFEQRTEMRKLNAASLKADDVAKLEQRIQRLEMKGLR